MCAEAAEEAVELVAIESSSEDEEQAGAPSLAKRKKQLEKEEDIKAAKKEVSGIFKKVRKVQTAEDIPAVFAEINDAVDHIAKELVHWKRAARRASKELARIKRECSCGRAVNYPFILR